MKEKQIIGSYKLEDYTIQYAGNKVRLLEIKVEEDFGVMFTSSEIDEFFCMIIIKEGRLTIKNLYLSCIEHFEIKGNVIDIIFDEL